MMKHSFKLALLVSFFSLHQLSALFDETLDGFVTRVVQDSSDQEGFRSYYSNFLDRQSKVSDKLKKHKLRKLRSEALSSLEIKNKNIYKKLADNAQLDLDKQDKNTRLFLVRYRLLEDYQQHKNTQHLYVWNKTKTYLTDLTNRVVTFASDIKNRFI